MITIDELRSIIEKIKEILIEKPKTKIFLDEIARHANIDAKTADEIYDLLLDLESILVDIEIDREMRGKYIRYYPDEDEDEVEDEEDFEAEEDEDVL